MEANKGDVWEKENVNPNRAFENGRADKRRAVQRKRYASGEHGDR